MLIQFEVNLDICKCLKYVYEVQSTLDKCYSYKC